MTPGHRQKPRKRTELAERAIADLLSEAGRIFPSDPLLAKKHVAEARKIGMRFKVSLTSPQKRKFCKTCGTYWQQGKNVRVRMTQHNLVYTCLECHAVRRIGKKKPGQ